MKIKKIIPKMRLEKIGASLVISSVLLSGGVVNSQVQPENLPQATPSPVNIISTEKEELERLRQEKLIRDRVAVEFDRAFSLTIYLLNTLLGVVIIVPILTTFGFILLRRDNHRKIIINAKNQLLGEIKNEISQEINDLQNHLELLQKNIKSIQIQTDLQFKSMLLHYQNLLEKNSQQQVVKNLPKIEHNNYRNIPEVNIIEYNHHGISAEKNLNNTSINNNENIEGENSVIQGMIDEKDIEKYLQTGDNLIITGRYHEAIACYDKVIAINYNYLEAWYKRGSVLIKMMRYEEALDCYNKAISIKSDDYESLVCQGYILTKLGRYGKANTSLNQALEIQPEYANTYYYKAYCYACQTQIELTIKNLQQAIYLNPEYKAIVENDPDFDIIRRHDRFQEFMHQV